MNRALNALNVSTPCTGIDFFFDSKPNSLKSVIDILKCLCVGIQLNCDTSEGTARHENIKLMKHSTSKPGEFCITIRWHKEFSVHPLEVMQRLHGILDDVTDYTGCELYLTDKFIGLAAAAKLL